MLGVAGCSGSPLVWLSPCLRHSLSWRVVSGSSTLPARQITFGALLLVPLQVSTACLSGLDPPGQPAPTSLPTCYWYCSHPRPRTCRCHKCVCCAAQERQRGGVWHVSGLGRPCDAGGRQGGYLHMAGGPPGGGGPTRRHVSWFLSHACKGCNLVLDTGSYLAPQAIH